MRFAQFAALCLLTALLGCGSTAPTPVDVTPAPTPAKKILEEIASSGAVTSGIMEVDSAVNDLRKTDAAKADKAQKALDELRSAKTPEEIKAKAKAAADQF